MVGVEPFEQAVRSAPTNWSARSVADEGGRGKNRASRNLARISGTMPIIFSEVAIHLGIFLGGMLLGFVLGTLFFVAYKHKGLWDAMGLAWAIALETGFWFTLFYCLYPLLSIVMFMIFNRQRPARDIFSRFTWDQNLGCLGLITLGVFYLFNHLTPTVLTYFKNDHGLARWPTHWLSTKPYIEMEWYSQLILVAAIAVLLTFIVPYFFPAVPKNRSVTLVSKKALKEAFGLFLGKTTGRLARLSHKTGIAEGLSIALTLEDASQNILVFGGIGAGKTTRIMQPLLVQCLDQSCGGLLFDVKGDVKQAVIKLGEMTSKPVTIIGPNHTHLNLLAGLSPEVAASFLKSAFLLSGGSKMDGFWVDTATELCRNTLGVLSFLPEHYTLQGLYGYLFEEDFKETLQESINGLLVTLEEKEQRLLKTYLRYHDNIFGTFDEKVKSGVNATVAQALSRPQTGYM